MVVLSEEDNALQKLVHYGRALLTIMMKCFEEGIVEG